MPCRYKHGFVLAPLLILELLHLHDTTASPLVSASCTKFHAVSIAEVGAQKVGGEQGLQRCRMFLQSPPARSTREPGKQMNAGCSLPSPSFPAHCAYWSRMPAVRDADCIQPPRPTEAKAHASWQRGLPLRLLESKQLLWLEMRTLRLRWLATGVRTGALRAATESCTESY